MSVRRDPLTGNIEIRHPAFTEQVRSVLNFADVQYSAEFGTFMSMWANGLREDTAFTRRNWDITRRKSSMGFLMLDLMGEFTHDGRLIAEDAKVLMRAVNQYNARMNRTLPNLSQPDSVSRYDSLDDLMLQALFTDRHVRMLSSLYVAFLQDKATKIAETAEADVLTHLAEPHLTEREVAQQKAQIDQQILEVKKAIAEVVLPYNTDSLAFLTYYGTTYLDTSKFRSYPVPRKILEHLLRMNLIEYIPLNRRLLGKGAQGRPLMGARLAPVGVRFMELYLRDFSEKWRRLHITNLDNDPSYQEKSENTGKTDNWGITDDELNILTMPSGLTVSIPSGTRAQVPVREEKAEQANSSKTIIHTDPSGVVIGASGPKMQMIMDLLADGVVMGRKDAEELLED